MSFTESFLKSSNERFLLSYKHKKPHNKIIMGLVLYNYDIEKVSVPFICQILSIFSKKTKDA